MGRDAGQIAASISRAPSSVGSRAIAAPLSFGTAQFVELLEVEPELARRAEEAAEPQRRVAGDRAAAGQDFGDPVHRHLDLDRELRRTHAKRFEVPAQRLARMDWLAHAVLLVRDHGRTIGGRRRMKARPQCRRHAERGCEARVPVATLSS